MQTFSSEDILNRLKDALSFDFDQQLADRLGISKSTLSSWKSRDSLDLRKVLAICEHVDLNWLFRGVTLDSCSHSSKAILEESSNLVALLMDKSEEIGRLKQRIEELERLKRPLTETIPRSALISVSSKRSDAQRVCVDHHPYDMADIDVPHAAEP